MLEGQILHRKALADYWLALATTGAVTKRKISHGTTGPEFTDEEKIQDALDTALLHIKAMSELVDQLPPAGGRIVG